MVDVLTEILSKYFKSAEDTAGYIIFFSFALFWIFLSRYFIRLKKKYDIGDDFLNNRNIGGIAVFIVICIVVFIEIFISRMKRGE